MTDPTPDTRETLDPDLIERAARAAFSARHPWGIFPAQPDDVRLWHNVGRAVLSEAAAQPLAPITAEDVRAAERAWGAWSELGDHLEIEDRAAFVADWLNIRGER